MVAEHLGKPLTQIPDPFGDHPSFGHHNNARLRAFLDTFGFDYEFLSATECYTTGRFDKTLLKVLQHYDAIRDVILPTLGPERRATYSPFLPISAVTGQVLQVPIIDRDTASGTIFYKEPETGRLTQVPVTQRPLQAAMEGRLGHALGGARRRLRDGGQGPDRLGAPRPATSAASSARSSRKASTTSSFSTRRARRSPSRAATASPSRSGSPMRAPRASALYMYQSPRKAKRLYFDVIPRAVDEYVGHLAAYPKEEQDAKLMNPVWHIHSGEPPKAELPISFALLLNLASASNSEDKEVLWGFIRRYAPDATPEAASAARSARRLRHPLLP